MFQEQPIFEFRGPWGVPVQVGASLFFLALIFIDFGAQNLAYQFAFFGLIVLSIFLHELGHAWGCLIQGVPVSRIMLYGGGGFCEHRRAASAQEDELIVAMGPIVNATIWALSNLALPYVAEPTLVWVLTSLIWINGTLTLLNLLPVLPLDGGKLFHLLLLRLMSPLAAMRIAGGIGLVISVAWVPAMVFTYLQYGMALLFIPPIGVHWHMMRARAV